MLKPKRANSRGKKQPDTRDNEAMANNQTVMQTGTASPAAKSSTDSTSIIGLLRNFTHEVRDLLRREIKLATTEISEKAVRFGRDALGVAVGVGLAYAGFMVFLLGLGFLLAWAFLFTGLQPIFAMFLGLAIVGFLILISGGCVALLGMSALYREPMAPERTIRTLRELRGAQPAPEEQQKASTSAEQPSSSEMQEQVERTQEGLGHTWEEMGRHVRPTYIRAEIDQGIHAHPYPVSLFAMAVGVASGFLVRHKFRHG